MFRLHCSLQELEHSQLVSLLDACVAQHPDLLDLLTDKVQQMQREDDSSYEEEERTKTVQEILEEERLQQADEVQKKMAAGEMPVILRVSGSKKDLKREKEQTNEQETSPPPNDSQPAKPEIIPQPAEGKEKLERVTSADTEDTRGGASAPRREGATTRVSLARFNVVV
eukprot:TRINITY_DN2462_c0_g2_i8.p2 TRINITY_DN2462_c0_g2~~TRINITY_DN2462_c0_g2_i8.p2  ORF type:complete len:192 (-),score=55.32 TRINITY_DN2462_c0_g2_i8:1639-2145(-)